MNPIQPRVGQPSSAIPIPSAPSLAPLEARVFNIVYYPPFVHQNEPKPSLLKRVVHWFCPPKQTITKLSLRDLDTQLKPLKEESALLWSIRLSESVQEKQKAIEQAKKQHCFPEHIHSIKKADRFVKRQLLKIGQKQAPLLDERAKRGNFPLESLPQDLRERIAKKADPVTRRVIAKTSKTLALDTLAPPAQLCRDYFQDASSFLLKVLDIVSRPKSEEIEEEFIAVWEELIDRISLTKSSQEVKASLSFERVKRFLESPGMIRLATIEKIIECHSRLQKKLPESETKIKDRVDQGIAVFRELLLVVPKLLALIAKSRNDLLHFQQRLPEELGKITSFKTLNQVAEQLQKDLLHSLEKLDIDVLRGLTIDTSLISNDLPYEIEMLPYSLLIDLSIINRGSDRTVDFNIQLGYLLYSPHADYERALALIKGVSTCAPKTCDIEFLAREFLESKKCNKALESVSKMPEGYCKKWLLRDIQKIMVASTIKSGFASYTKCKK